MVAFKKFAAPVLVSAALAFSSASALALNVGDAGSLADMQNKLASENQTEIATAVTGGNQALRGVKFYYNQTSKVGYVALTDDPVRPTQMRIVMQTNNTDYAGPVVVPQPEAGIQECQQLIAQQRVKQENCGSLYSVLKTGQDLGRMFFQQGKLNNGNTLVTVLNAARGDGTIYESTPNGATTSKLAFGGAKYTPEGSRLIASLGQRKIASSEENTPKMR